MQHKLTRLLQLFQKLHNFLELAGTPNVFTHFLLLYRVVVNLWCISKIFTSLFTVLYQVQVIIYLSISQYVFKWVQTFSVIYSLIYYSTFNTQYRPLTLMTYYVCSGQTWNTIIHDRRTTYMTSSGKIMSRNSHRIRHD